MHKHRFQNLIKLLIALQFLLPSGGPWLHTLIDRSRCASAGSFSGSCCVAPSHSHRCTSRSTHKHSHGNKSAPLHQHSHAKSHDGESSSKSHTQHSDRHLQKHSPSDSVSLGASKPASEPQQPHNCSDCPVCQAICAPRILALILQLPEFDEHVGCLYFGECADPLLGFGLPLQCRAPPAVA